MIACAKIRATAHGIRQIKESLLEPEQLSKYQVSALQDLTKECKTLLEGLKIYTGGDNAIQE